MRVVVVDDHPALRIGLEAVLCEAPGVTPVGSAVSEIDLWPLLHRTDPDLVLLDYQLPGVDGLHVCRRIKDRPPAPFVVMYSAYAGGEFEVAAAIAGADGVVPKSATAATVAERIRRVAADAAPDRPTPDALQRAGRCLEAEDLPILGMVLEGTPRHEIGATLGVPPSNVTGRLDRMIAALADCVALE